MLKRLVLTLALLLPVSVMMSCTEDSGPSALVNRPPAFTVATDSALQADTVLYAGQQYSRHIGATDPDAGDELVIVASNQFSGMSGDSIGWVPFDTGWYDAWVKVTDGHASDSIGWQIHVVGSGPSIPKEQIIGQWVVVKAAYAWDWTEAGVRDQGSATEVAVDTEVVTIVTDSTLDIYAYEGSFACYMVVGGPYVLSGSAIVDADPAGDFFAGTETDVGVSWTWSTTVAMSGDTLVVTMRESGYDPYESGWEEETLYLVPYTGSVPRAGWVPCYMPKKLGKRRRR